MKNVRLHLDVPLPVKQRLEQRCLQLICGFKTHILNAINIYYEILIISQCGGDVILRAPSKPDRIITIPEAELLRNRKS